MLRSIMVLSFLLSVFSGHALSKSYTAIEWVDLIPQEDLTILLNPPPSINTSYHDFDSLSLDDFSYTIEKQIEQATKIPTPEEQIYAAALESTNIKAEFDQQNIRIPGFIVPIEYSDTQVITEFFLVPYFGACIHVPAPPPNQVIYVKYPQGLHVTALYDPFWIEGQLATAIVENDIATSAYTMTADNVKAYEEYEN